jgi:hypothetical protein
MSTRIFFTAVVVVLASALFSACGAEDGSRSNSSLGNSTGASAAESNGNNGDLGGGGSTTENPGEENSVPLSRTEFINEANAVCQERLEEKDRIVEAALSTFSERNVKQAKKELESLAVSRILPILEEMTNQLDHLTPPPEDSDTVEGIIGQLDIALEVSREDPSELTEGSPLTAASEAAQSYGLSACVF